MNFKQEKSAVFLFDFSTSPHTFHCQPTLLFAHTQNRLILAYLFHFYFSPLLFFQLWAFPSFSLVSRMIARRINKSSNVTSWWFVKWQKHNSSSSSKSGRFLILSNSQRVLFCFWISNFFLVFFHSFAWQSVCWLLVFFSYSIWIRYVRATGSPWATPRSIFEWKNLIYVVQKPIFAKNEEKHAEFLCSFWCSRSFGMCSNQSN